MCFICLDPEKCIYVRDNVFILVYVDDLLIFGADLEKSKAITHRLSSGFSIKTMGPLSK